ncbi:MAG: carbohydrate binding domain-containing protein [Ruminococcus sp.]|nr:carbohydrate binding domain-containing protein [Ruminococcus sp.]
MKAEYYTGCLTSRCKINIKKRGKFLMKKAISILAASVLSLSALTAIPSAYAAEDAAAEYLLSCSFEDGEQGWTGRGSASVESSSKAYFKGSKSLYCSGREDKWNGASYALGSSFTPGTSYSFSANVMYETGIDNLKFHLTMQYDNGTETKYDKIASSEFMKGKWGHLANVDFTIPAGASDISIYIETDSGTSDFYVDEVQIAAAGTEIEGAKGGKFLLGDVNSDGAVDTFDFVASKALLVANEKDADHVKLADVDKSTEFEVNDVVLLQDFLLGKITEFPDNAPEPVIPPFEYEANKQFKTAPNDYFNSCSQAGTVTKETYNGIRGTKSLNVYTPYGYDPSKKYNIFYLMHGGSENENTLFFQNDTMIQNLLDHMIMNGELEPMIVVTPTFNGNGSEAQNFYEELRASVIPFVEEKYSTYAESTSEDDIRASRMHRAYGGFSMGAVSTWAVFQNDLDLVGYFMPLSGDHWTGSSDDEKARNLANAVDKGGYKWNQYFIFAATGSNDMAYPNENPQIQAMKNYSQFKYTSDFSQGNLYFLVAQGYEHTWRQVRHYIYNALPYFFHETGE